MVGAYAGGYGQIKVIQYHPDVIDGCLTITGLTFNTTPAITK